MRSPTGSLKPTVRALFVLAVLVVPVQHVVKKREGEPYPGLYQPSFSGVPQSGRKAFATQPEVHVTYADGSTRRFTAEQLLPENPTLPTHTLSKALVRDAAVAEDPRTVSWLRGLVRSADRRGGEPVRAEVVEVVREYDVYDGSSRATETRRVRTLEL